MVNFGYCLLKFLDFKVREKTEVPLKKGLSENKEMSDWLQMYQMQPFNDRD